MRESARSCSSALWRSRLVPPPLLFFTSHPSAAMPATLLSPPALRPPPIQTSPSFQRALSANSNKVTKRARSSSIVSVQEIPENYDDTLDQGALNNVNADWVNYKGAQGGGSLGLGRWRGRVVLDRRLWRLLARACAGEDAEGTAGKAGRCRATTAGGYGES